MSDLKVAISSPIDDNLYSLLVSQLCIDEEGVSVCGIISLKVFSIKRIRSEYKRLGHSLFVKIMNRLSTNIYKKNSTAQEKYLLISKVGLREKSIKDISNKYKIPYLKVDNPNNHDAVKFLKNQNPDLILSIGSNIIRKQFLEIPTIGVLNVHMGILPEYRGIGVTEWPIIENRVHDVGLGITLHFMDSGVDTGPIVDTKKINIHNCNSLDELESKYLNEMVSLMIKGVKMARDNELLLKPQKKDGIDRGKQYFSTHQRMRLLAENKFKSLLK
jgi:methionyl-tRNA formyltransferase